jgi:ATP-binding cassette subfamily C protein CydCD
VKFFDPRLFRFSRSSRGFISLSILAALTLTFLTILQAMTIADLVVRAFQKREAVETLKTSILLLIFIFTARALLAIASDLINRRISARIRAELRSLLFTQSINKGAEINAQFGAGKLSLVATRGITQLEPYFNRFIPQLFIALFVPLFVGITIALNDFLSGVIILFTIPLIPLFGILIGKYTESAMMKKWRTMGLLSNFIVDLFNGLLTLKVFNRSQKQEEKIHVVGERYRAETMKVLRISFLSSLALELIATLSVALLAVSIGLRLVNGSISLNVGLIVLLLAPEVYWPIRQVSALFHASAEGVTAASEIFDILDLNVNLPQGSITPPPNIKALAWTDIEIEYPNRITQRISAHEIRSGELTVIAGPSGSGKTTLINTLLSLVTPLTGVITLHHENGHFNLQDINREQWLRSIAWVSQDPQFPPGLISQSLREIAEDNKQEIVAEALRITGLHDSILEKTLTDNNNGISLGQLRRLAIVRALISQRSIIVLDEPTASLDQESEISIAKHLQDFAHKGNIVLAVSHSPELISLADHVIDLNKNQSNNPNKVASQ